MQQPPERIVIDTNLPTIVPPPTLASNAIPDEPPPQVYASIVSHMPVTGVEKKKSKAKKRQVAEIADKRPSSARTIMVVNDGPSTIAPPPTRLSFASIISGQLVRDLLNLH
jgi:hypothetical protein